MKEFIPKTRPDGYNGPVSLPQFADNDDWCFEEWLHCRPVRSSDQAAKWSGFDQVDAVKPIALEYAAIEIKHALDLFDQLGLDKIIQAQLNAWDQGIANSLCSLAIPMFGYDATYGADENSWKQVFAVWFPEFDIHLLEQIKTAISEGDVGVEAWHNDGPGTSFMGWVVSWHQGGSPLFSVKGSWVAFPDYKWVNYI